MSYFSSGNNDFESGSEDDRRLRGDRGIFWSTRPEIALLLLAVSGFITFVIFVANWEAATNALFKGDEVNPETGCRWGYEAVDRYTCSATGWWTFGRWIGAFFLLNLVLFIWGVVTAASSNKRARH